MSTINAFMPTSCEVCISVLGRLPTGHRVSFGRDNEAIGNNNDDNTNGENGGITDDDGYYSGDFYNESDNNGEFWDGYDNNSEY